MSPDNSVDVLSIKTHKNYFLPLTFLLFLQVSHCEIMGNIRGQTCHTVCHIG